ncbi:MAG: porin family protein [Alphaproteobacteria bacterium]|nr:porin family protein [Alphaproteobacteria bacterium]
MKKILFLLAGIGVVCGIASAQAQEPIAYGDLYNVEWCPCNPEEPFDADGSVVMGKTVMCPCNGLYSGYKKGFEQDVRELKNAAKNQLRKLNYFKYYLGLDYNMGTTSAGSEDIAFDDLILAGGPIKVKPDDVLDDQDSLSFVAGARISKYWGLEAFYQQSYDDNTATSVDSVTLNNPDYHLMNDYTTSFRAFGLDLIGYAPVSPYFDFVGSLGLAQYKFENEALFTSYYLSNTDPRDIVKQNFDEDKIGWRAGIGAQLNIADGIALRAMYKYIYIGGDLVEDLNEFSLGLRFLF